MPNDQRVQTAEAGRLLADLGFRPPDADEVREVAELRAAGSLSLPLTPAEALLPVTLLSAQPVISYSGLSRAAQLGAAGVMTGVRAAADGWFLLSPTWTIDDADKALSLRRLAILHRLANPGHRLIFMGNTPQETERMQELGEAAFFYSKLANVREDIFRPLNGIGRDLDAIYNAQLVAWKRHDLSLAIPRCGFLFYRDRGFADGAAEEAEIRARHAEKAPGHQFINQPRTDGSPRRLKPAAVNRHLNRAPVGLCLSEREGAMFVSMEYQMAGLGIVTTPSIGGREIYFDGDYCLTVPADPRAVRDAVTAIKARGVPPEHIRSATLKRVDADRRRFLALLDCIVATSGRRPRFGQRWLFDQPVMMRWYPAHRAISRVVQGRVDAYTPRRLRYWTARFGVSLRTPSSGHLVTP